MVRTVNEADEWPAHMKDHEPHELAHGFVQKERNEYGYTWPIHAHQGQLPPPGDWSVWLIMAGRGFGKTRAGAEWIRMIAETRPHARIALVAANLSEARSILVEGESGILACAPPDRRPVFEPSLHRLTWPAGAQANLYSALEPESLRGPQHSHAWCDEVAKWSNSGGRAIAAWDNLSLGMRIGVLPRILATTTPRAVALVKRLAADPEVVCSTGRTEDNAIHLPKRYLRDIRRAYGKSLLGRQELDGELIEDLPGALWTRALIEDCREAAVRAPLARIVVGVDPPASSKGDACGIVVAGIGEDGVGHVLADASLRRPSPERWAQAVARTARAWQADRVVAEANQGGDMVASVLRAAEIALPLKLVHASKGKSARAEPVAALYEAGRVRHAGIFPELEDELCGLMAGGAYEGPGRSPDRADALVWALSELMLARRSRPRVWVGL